MIREEATMHRIPTLAATAAAAFAVAAAPAAAHTEVKSSSPAKGSTASTSIRTATVTFTQAIQRGTLKVTGPGGVTVSNGSGGRDPRKVTRLRVGLKGSLKAGRYKLRWTIKAADGHTQSGTIRFKLR
jgi:methionine-rich copper-binding protein CopC